MKYVIISGGTIQDDFACSVIKQEKADRILGADSGMEFLKRNRIKPDVIIGDYDSVNGDTLKYFKTMGDIEFHTLNPIKDDTDTESAIRYAIAHGATEIILLGATGTRLDHVLGNISLLGIGLEHGIPIIMLDAHNRVRMLDRGITLKKAEQFGKYVSLIPFGDWVEDLTLMGMKYPLDRYRMGGFNSLGVSNEIQEEEARIEFSKGVVIMIESRD